MDNLNLRSDLVNYLNENYFFIYPEIYSYFNLNVKLFFVHKKDIYYNKNKERLDNLCHLEFLEENLSTENWIVYDESKHLKWFADEFRLMGYKHLSKNVKEILQELFKTHDFAKKLILPTDLIKIFQEERIDCSKIKTIEDETERKSQIFTVNETIFFNQFKSKYSNPGVVLNKNSDDNIKILYFTYIDNKGLEINSKHTNSWSILRVSNKEIGKSPQEAKQNSYL